MDIFKLNGAVDLYSLAAFGVMVIVFYSVLRRSAEALKKTQEALKLQSESLKLQSNANHQLHLLVNEVRRSNRLLAELSEMTEEGSAEGIEPLNTVIAEPASAEPETQPDPQHKLYVGNIEYTATEEELGAYFSQYGEVEFVNIPVNRYTGKARGFGFVTFVSKEDAERAMALNGTEFKGRQIQVNFAKEREIA